MPLLIPMSLVNDLWRGNIDLDTDTFRVMLSGPAYVPNVDTHAKRSAVTNEIVGTGYLAGGPTVTLGLTRDDANNRWNLSLGAASWASSTLTNVRVATYYKSRGGLATLDEIIAWNVFDSDISSASALFSLAASTMPIQLPAG